MGDRPGILGISGPGLILALVLAAAPTLRAQSAPRPDDRRGKPARTARGDDRPPPASDDAPTTPKAGGLRMSRAVVCKEINGYENYKVLPGAAQTSDEKLLIYFRPLRYKIDYVDGLYRAHLVQDNEIRKRGRKEIVRQKKKVVEYNPKSKEPLGPIFIRNSISLKGLEPGEYALTIILRDELDQSAPPTRQVVRFKVIPPHDTRTEPETPRETPPS